MFACEIGVPKNTVTELGISAVIDAGLFVSKGPHTRETSLKGESRRCSRDTYPESYITKYTSIVRPAVYSSLTGCTSCIVDS